MEIFCLLLSALALADVADATPQRQALLNIQTVLEESGSSLKNMVKVWCMILKASKQGWLGQCNIYLTDMVNYAAMNKACKYFQSY
jgi:enamine deaminase RidA (YjgF/YER057c/UK114 family)